MVSKVITWSFFILFGFTPLFFLPNNSELFEFNKMRLVYGLTVIIASAWIIKSIQLRKLIFRQTPFDLPLLIFLASQILSTVFSIDTHTSIWGYYSRSNGGLLSILSYVTLYYALVSNYQGDEVLKFLKATVFGGLMVALYAIPEHFGVSPSCIILTGTWGVDCWVQLVQERVFATLGQPNWLAAYLGMAIFPAIYFYLTAEKLRQKIFYLGSGLLMYMAFTFTFSRGGLLGFLAGLAVFVLGVLITQLPQKGFKENAHRIRSKQSKNPLIQFFLRPELRPLEYLIAGILIINLLFGSALTGSFRLIQHNAPPARPGIVSGGTQLENGGTESGRIRLIVWKGALEIFKHYPLFGSGVETFAYSYYQYRPAEHNLVSEWDFLYNKAHNEYLNYLATTGIVGFGSYILIIGLFILWSIQKITNYKLQIMNLFLNSKPFGLAHGGLKIVNSKLDLAQKLLVLSLLSGYVSYLVQNIFGFSVVMIALLFFLFPALAVISTESAAEPSASFLKMFSFINPLIGQIYKRQLYTKMSIILVIIFGIIFTSKIYQNWEADAYYKKGNDFVDSGYVGEGFNTFVEAIDLNGSEPLYRSEIGFAAAASAVSHFEVDATEAARIKNIAVTQTEKGLEISPKNTSLWRTAIRTYYQLSSIDPAFEQKTVETIDRTISLAPTDPKLYFNKGLILAAQKKMPEAIIALEQAIKLKPNYLDTMLMLSDFYYEEDQKDKAINLVQEVIKQSPNNEEAIKKLDKFNEK